MDELTGDWRQLHDEELHNLYSSPNIIRVIKSKNIRTSGSKEKCVQNFGRKPKRTGIAQSV
jgi:hypothetical protein